MKNILSIDVEEIFQIEYAKKAKLDKPDFKTPSNLPIVLGLLKEYNVKATFFVVGQVAERFPKILSDIVNGKHEVAFHSYDHVSLWKKTSSQLIKEISDFNLLSVQTTGKKCIGFRAPSFSLDYSTIWAINSLLASGICYDSSLFPTWTPLYGVKDAPKHPYRPSNDDLTKTDVNSALWEFPLATYTLLNLTIPAAGGFYLRLMPSIVRKAIKHLNKKGYPAVLYLHNWELDPKTPRLELGLYKSFVTYHNENKTVTFLKNLLDEFQFTSFANYMKDAGMD
jgi:polysaccharide deacetylase family protein (PEP-CTERM system associated)